MTQMELAKALQTSQSAITAYESSRREPSFLVIERMASFFGVPMSALLPSNDSRDEDFTGMIAESLHQNEKLKLLFDKTRKFDDSDLDAVLAVVNAISRERDTGA